MRLGGSYPNILGKSQIQQYKLSMPQTDKQFGETIKQFCSFETNNFRSLGRLVRLEAI